jgi:hypothetical protein
MNSTNEHCIDVCNSLLRGEISAVETYSRAIEKHASSPVVEELRRIRSEHTRAANLLSANVREMGGEPERDSGAWGMLTAAIQGTANLFGPESAVESLQKGEEIGRRQNHDPPRAFTPNGKSHCFFGKTGANCLNRLPVTPPCPYP